MHNFSYHLPVKIEFGAGCITKLSDYVEPSMENILIVSEKNVFEKSTAVKGVMEQLAHKNVSLFLDVEENPSFQTIEKGKEIARKNNTQLVIGIGGGSPMDAAKGIAVLALNEGRLENIIQDEKSHFEALPVICIPTTSGTGSEVTPYAVFSDTENHNKCGFSHPHIFPKLALVDPELSFSMPESVIVNTGLDALTHSIEAYLSTLANPMNDMYAIESIKTVLKNLPEASLKNKEAMSKMAYASMLGGIAITHGGTILLHIMGYPLTAFHNIAHGKANAILLPAFLNFMRKHSTVKDKIQSLDAMFEKHGGIEEFVTSMGISARLSSYGIGEQEITTFTKKVIVKGDVQITPAIISEREIANIYYSTL